MKLTEAKNFGSMYYNKTTKFILPLYDYNYFIENENIKFVGAFLYCPYTPMLSDDYLYLAYIINDENEHLFDKFPDLNKVEIFQVKDELLAIVVLNKPGIDERDWKHMLNAEYNQISKSIPFRLMNHKVNHYTREYIWEVFHDSPNREHSRKQDDKFDGKDIIDW
jgi:hypothetical protein